MKLKWQCTQHVIYSAVTVSICGFAVGFGRLKKIKTAVYGQFRFLWFQMLIMRTVNSVN